jgi:hypothetical protein
MIHDLEAGRKIKRRDPLSAVEAGFEARMAKSVGRQAFEWHFLLTRCGMGMIPITGR